MRPTQGTRVEITWPNLSRSDATSPIECAELRSTQQANGTGENRKEASRALPWQKLAWRLMAMACPVAIGLGLGACEESAAPPAATAKADAADAAIDAAPKVPAPPPPIKWYVFDTVSFTRQISPGVVDGFDIDGLQSAEGDPKGCGHADFTSPAGTKGIDNQFALLVPAIEKSGIAAFEKLLQASIESGGVLLMVELQGLDSWSDDPQVKVIVRAGQGLPLLGTDGKLLTGQTFHVNSRDPAALAGTVPVKDGWLEAGPFDMLLPVQVFGKDYTLDMRGTRIRMRVVDGETLEAGVVGGGITLASIRALAKQAAEDQGNIDELVDALTLGMVDLAPDATGDCQQLSAALTFSGVGAYFYPSEVTKTGL